LIKLGKRSKRRGGFTLVELLLVVAILAVLAFLAVPAIAQTIRNSRMRTCASNERMVEQNIWRWYSDGVAAGLTLNLANGSYLTDVTIDAFDAEFDYTGVDWPELGPYFTPSGVPSCPFTDDQSYVIRYRILNGGLDDVFVICNDSVDHTAGGHPRSDDRRDPGNMAGQFPGP
jgi:prepilin-type N-terminal cleavage/methylation domain-containing protein